MSNLPSRPTSGVGPTEEEQPRYASRIFKDIQQFFTDPIPDIMFCPDTDNLLISHAVIIGPEGTPYEGGFFYFYIKLPPDYPFSPPHVTLMTTDRNSVRFNPNLYKNGKVCLSILNTWIGPRWVCIYQIQIKMETENIFSSFFIFSWTSGSTLSSVLLSIQSIMNAEPYYNEPGASSLRTSSNPVKLYNDIILHETIRVAVIGMMQENNLDTKHMPSVLKEFITKYFKTKMSYYDKVIDDNIRSDGLPMTDPFNEPRGLFQYKKLKVEIDKLRQKYCPSESSAEQPH